MRPETEAVLKRVVVLCDKLGINTTWCQGAPSLPFGSFGWTGDELVVNAGLWNDGYWYDPFHEIAHWLVAEESRRTQADFSSSVDVDCEDWRDAEELDASALGIWLHLTYGEDPTGAEEHARAHSWQPTVKGAPALPVALAHLQRTSPGLDRARAWLQALGLTAPPSMALTEHAG
jgi:hypothetical protein